MSRVGVALRMDRGNGWGVIYRQALPVIGVSLLAGLFAGTVLGAAPMRRAIASVPGVLLLLPAFLATRGGVYGSLGARLSSGLHQGVLPTAIDLADRRLRNAIVASVVNGIAVSLFIAAVAAIILWIGGGRGSLLVLAGIMLIAGGLSALVMVSVLVSVLFVGYRRGLDPDNLIGPIVTTLGDVFGVLFLYIAIAIVGAIL